MALYHVFSEVENRRTGVPMAGVQVRVKYDDTDTEAPIYADQNGAAFTPENYCVTDADGMYSFYVNPGEYKLEFLVGSEIIKTIRDFRPAEVGPAGPANSTYATTAELESADTANVSAILAETGKAGTFTTREYADFTAQVAADTGKVNYIRSVFNPTKVWVRTSILTAGAAQVGTAAGVTVETELSAKATALGIAATATNLGTFTGGLIPANKNAKEALQALSDAVQNTSGNAATKVNATAVGIPATDANMGTTPGTILSDNGTAKQWFQESEAAIEVGGKFLQSGSGAVSRTGQDKLRERISVKDFGAVGNGISDDYPAFLAAFNACPTGGVINVPYTSAAGYYLSANPDNGSKRVTWDFDTGVLLSGAGIGTPGSGGGTFGSLKTNPWLRVASRQNQQDLAGLRSPTGGAVIGDSWEWFGLNNSATIAITGTLTNGSAVISGIASTAGIYPGDGVLSAVGGWPSGATRSNTMRVISVTANSITVGLDNGGGSGTAAPTNWAGATTSGVSFTVRRRHWMAGRYEGADTGTGDNIDIHYELANPVMNITGAAGVMYEFNLNSYALTADFNRAIFITGGGDTQNDKLVAIDIQRGGTVKWATGISIRHAQVGLFANAKYPVQIDTSYNNRQTGLAETIGYGIHFNNAPALAGSLFEGGQLANGSDAITVWRNTDTSPTGKFINFKNAANNADLMFVGVDGDISTFAPNSSAGSTTKSGSIRCNGLTIRGGCNLRLGVDAQTATKAATGKYLEIVQSDGTSVYVPTFA